MNMVNQRNFGPNPQSQRRDSFSWAVLSRFGCTFPAQTFALFPPAMASNRDNMESSGHTGKSNSDVVDTNILIHPEEPRSAPAALEVAGPTAKTPGAWATNPTLTWLLVAASLGFTILIFSLAVTVSVCVGHALTMWVRKASLPSPLL